MNRIVFALAVLFILTTACTKNYTCVCDVYFSGTTSTKFNDTKSKATNDCNALNATTATQTVTCALN